MLSKILFIRIFKYVHKHLIYIVNTFYYKIIKNIHPKQKFITFLNFTKKKRTFFM